MRTTGDSALTVPDDLVVVGKITTVHGVKGWVKIHSYTDPESNIFDYQPWWLKMPEGCKPIKVDQHRGAAKGFLAHIDGIDDREIARQYCRREIMVSADRFPVPGADEVYLHQLEGLRVVTAYDGEQRDLGVVTGFMDTGAGEVMMVSGDAGSLDRIERLIPFVEVYIVDVDLEARRIVVDSDPAFERGG